jgi:hypothetical protein
MPLLATILKYLIMHWLKTMLQFVDMQKYTSQLVSVTMPILWISHLYMVMLLYVDIVSSGVVHRYTIMWWSIVMIQINRDSYIQKLGYFHIKSVTPVKNIISLFIIREVIIIPHSWSGPCSLSDPCELMLNQRICYWTSCLENVLLLV